MGEVMTIHTTHSLRASRHRLETRLKKAELVLNAMRGACLHLQYTHSGPVWVLTTGQFITDAVARLVTNSGSVVGVGDALFDGAASQTFRWWRET
jgi:hypothetical protein